MEVMGWIFTALLVLAAVVALVVVVASLSDVRRYLHIRRM